MSDFDNNSASNQALRREVAELFKRSSARSNHASPRSNHASPRSNYTTAQAGTRYEARLFGERNAQQFEFRGGIDPDQSALSCLESACADMQMCGITNAPAYWPILAGSDQAQLQASQGWIQKVEDRIQHEQPSTPQHEVLSRALAHLKRFEQLKSPHQGYQRRG